MSSAKQTFLSGVIEGFYGKPWTQAERFELFDWMSSWGLNTYLYAPKDDLKHRAIWREPYSASELQALGELIRRCSERNIRFIYGISPGLDIRYANEVDLDHLRKRFEQMARLGCENFCLLFDDIPGQVDADDTKRFGSLAAAQCGVANSLQNQVPYLLFCPTAYCARMADRKYGGGDYLLTIGRELSPDIDIFWTGPEIISREITAPHIQQLQTVLRRKPLIWDNLFANDYDGRRFYCGPYSGRPPELRNEVSGILVNPNNEFPLNYVPLRTFAEFIRCMGKWNSREAYLRAMKEWLPRFETVSQSVTLNDLILFGDCYYLPYEQGPEAEALLRDDVRGDRAKRLRDFCARIGDLRDRKLFYALSRRVWELREELDLLINFHDRDDAGQPYRSDSHLPGTFRGGIVAQLQRLLTQQSDGSFVRSTK